MVKQASLYEVFIPVLPCNLVFSAITKFATDVTLDFR